MRAITYDSSGSAVIARPREYLTIKGQDLIGDRFLVYNGKSLMRYIVYRFKRKLTMVENDKLESLQAPDDKRFYPVFRWEGDQLFIDNTETFLNEPGDKKTSRSGVWT